MSKKALVTGASGFIGSTLIRDLNEQGYEVFALMRRTSSPKNLEGLSFTKVEGDLGNEESLRRAVQGMDYVFHLAGVTAAPNREFFFEHNANGSERIARAAAEVGKSLKRFVYVSSIAAGGPAAGTAARTEAEPSKPVSAYGESKLAGELAVLQFKDKMPISIVRPPIVYGPKDKGVFVIIQSVARRLAPMIAASNPTGHKYYSVVHADDLCQGIIRAAEVTEAQAPSGEVFYVSGDGVHTYQDLVRSMAAALQCKPFEFRIPRAGVMVAAAAMSGLGAITRRTYPFNLDKLNEVLPDYWICSNEKAKQILGYKPQYDLTRGMSHAIDWYKRNNWL